MEVRPIDANALEERMDEILMPGKDAAMESYIDEIVCAVIHEQPTLSLNTLRDVIYQDAVAHGLWDYPQYCRTKNEMLDYVRAACVERIREELMEAMEAVSDPRQFAKELADSAITIFSVAGHLSIDIDAAIRRKMEINKKRPWKHGK